MKHIKHMLAVVIVSTTLGGCANVFDIKKTDFGCAGMPQGVKCLSVKEVYSATESSDYVNGEVAAKWRERQGKKAEGAAASGEAAVAQAPEVTPAADKPRPIRHPAQVMRVWINSFEDDDGDLYAGQYVFTEIEPRRWSIGMEKSGEKGGLDPLSTGSSRNSVRETESPLAIVKNK